MTHCLRNALVLLLLSRTQASGQDGKEGAGTCSHGQECAPPMAEPTEHEDDVSLMQTLLSSSRRGSKVSQAVSLDHSRGQVVAHDATCSDLANKGAYFTVAVKIGTPEQEFNLVADTGSDALIIPDCKCVEAGYCKALETCFAAVNSTSFGIDIKPTQSKGGDKNALAIMGAKMNYGSGQIQVLVASEKVRVSSISAEMHNGVFLMEDRRQLEVHGDFQGILGLGLPHKKPLTKMGIHTPAFMELSGVRKYTVCFNEWPNPGALRSAVTSLPNAMTNIGTVHWGLGLHGFSVGNESADVLFCSPKDKNKKQTTPCGAIPDSGTTLMMGPADHIRKLYSSICENWPRCKKSAEKLKVEKDKAFHELLYSCEAWMTDGEGVNEIPSIFLHLAGSEGKAQTVELSAWAYIVETTQEIYKVVTAKIFGVLPVAAAIDTGKKKKICTASFGPQKYNTVKNGPVWIMGAPLFYATTVGYDLGSGGNHKIAFVKGACKKCNETASFISSERVTNAAAPHVHQRALRSLSGPIREPSIDVSGPL